MKQLNTFFTNKLKKYLPKKDNNTKGFFLFNPPTGSGKTTVTIDYIATQVNSKSKRKIFFITNLKENLDKPFKKLEHKINSKRRVIRLLSVGDELCKLCKNNLWVEPKSYKFKYYQEFKESVERYCKTKSSDKKYKSFLKDSYEIQEKKFKLEIYQRVNELKKKRDNISLKILKQELKKIYKTIDLIKDYDVIFLTTQKFLYPIYDPFQGSDYLYNVKEFKNNSICFIDEFDSQKNIFLQIEIEKFLEVTKDYISIFLKIYSGLYHKEYFKKFEYQDELEELKIYFKEIYKKNNLQYSHKLEDKNSKVNVLFKDIEYFSIDNKYYNLKTDKERQTNIINRLSYKEFEQSKKENLGLLETLNDIIVSINYFISKVNKVSQEYYNQHSDRLEFSNAISTVLNELNISKNDNIHEFLKRKILERNKIRFDYYSDWSKNSFYDKGFRYFIFQNSIDFDTKTNIDFKVFENTPEKILAQIAEKSFIVGISATALNKSVTSNFNLEYLKNRFKDNFFHLNRSELDELKKLYINAKKDTIENYKVEIINYPDLLKDDTSRLKEEAKKLFGDDKEEWIENHQSKYHISAYFRIVNAYLKFRENNEIQSFLYLTNSYPSENKDRYEAGICKEYLDELLKRALRYKSYEYIENDELYFIYNSEDKQIVKYEKEIKEKLKEGKKVFVISVYQSIGIGKNIQYTVLDTQNNEIEKDFDAIYLDKPTHLLEEINIQNGEIEKEKSLIKYIYQLETLFTDAQIDRMQLKESIKSAFSKTFDNSVNYSNYYRHSDSNDYKYSASKIIIQAIGRLHRTSRSSQKFIFIDNRLSFLSSYFDENSFNLLSFDAIINKLKESNRDSIKKDTIYEVIKNKNIKVRSRINDTLDVINSYQTIKNKKKIKEWKEIREFVLKNPTLKSMDTINQDRYELFYFPYKRTSPLSPLKYFYKQYNDYRDIEISWDAKKEFIEVSDKGARLDLVRKNTYLKEKFEENKYALYFNTYSLFMMIPIVFNNIYKGALGEKIGKFLLEENKSLELLELEESEFEKFDYKVGDRVYIDFKYFGESTGRNINKDTLVSKAKKKLKEISGEKAIIINCFGDNNKYISRPYRDDNVSIYPFIINSDSVIDYKIIQEIREEIKNANKSV